MWEGHVDNFIVFLRSQGLVATSIRTKRNHVLQLARAFPDIPPTELDPGSLVEWCGTRAWANETRHAYYSTFRRFFGWLDARQHCGNISSVLPRIRRPSGTPRPIPDSILVDCVDHASPRDALILRLAAEAGLRCVEIAQVEVGDVYEGADGWDLLCEGRAVARGPCRSRPTWQGQSLHAAQQLDSTHFLDVAADTWPPIQSRKSDAGFYLAPGLYTSYAIGMQRRRIPQNMICSLFVSSWAMHHSRRPSATSRHPLDLATRFSMQPAFNRQHLQTTRYCQHRQPNRHGWQCQPLTVPTISEK